MTSRVSWTKIAVVVICFMLSFSMNRTPLFAQTPVSIERVSVASDGTQGNGQSIYAALSVDSRFVAFRSAATNLVDGDNNGAIDIFVRDRQAGQTTRVSVSSNGSLGNAFSFNSSLSGDGRFVAFSSFAGNLVAGDTNETWDVFMRDRQAGQTTRVSVSSSGTQAAADGVSLPPVLSTDGRYVAFNSSNAKLVPGDSNGVGDVFVHDRQSRQTTRVSVSSSGSQGNGWSGSPAISADGRFVAFTSAAKNLVSGDTNGAWDVFVYDRQTGQTRRVSVSSSGTQGNGYSVDPAISADGRFVAFASLASNLVAGDRNNAWDIFVHDRQTGQTTRVSTASDGTQANRASTRVTISADGQLIAFSSLATNLVEGDTNKSEDIFVHDWQTGQTIRVSVATDGSQGNGSSSFPVLSADGQFIAFSSSANNLVANDTNNAWDVFLVEISFSTSPPPSPDNAAPPRNYFTTSTPTLTWNRVTGATEYEIQVDASPAFSEPLDFSAIISADTLEATTFPLVNGTYYWRMRVKNGSASGVWSAADSFVVDS
jgi:Tol biopolymer transport system component